MSQQQVSEERHHANEMALAECIYRGVSAEAIAQLAYEAGIPTTELNQIYREQEKAS